MSMFTVPIPRHKTGGKEGYKAELKADSKINDINRASRETERMKVFL